MTFIIINADDFGYSDGICRSVLELLDAGAISGTSLMCAAYGAQERCHRWSVSSLRSFAGVHLQLSGGNPISPPHDIPTLLAADMSGFRDFHTGELPSATHVELEWRRQIEVASSMLGTSPTHLDSHRGVHRIPEFFEIYVRLASELKIPIRGAGGEIGTRMRSDGVPGTVALVREWTGRSLGPDALRRVTREVVQTHPNEHVIEVISHPGYNDNYLASLSSLSQAREDDHNALLQLFREGWLEADGYTLASHADLIALWNDQRTPRE
jgi:chitin disaccharide deacetylase